MATFCHLAACRGIWAVEATAEAGLLLGAFRVRSKPGTKSAASLEGLGNHTRKVVFAVCFNLDAGWHPRLHRPARLLRDLLRRGEGRRAHGQPGQPAACAPEHGVPCRCAGHDGRGLVETRSRVSKLSPSYLEVRRGAFFNVGQLPHRQSL